MKPETHDQYRTRTMEDARLYQDFVMMQFIRKWSLVIQVFSSQHCQYKLGESLQGYEIKFDAKYANTGNLWIEVSEKAFPRDGDYAPSGIFRSDNSRWYVIGDFDTIFVFRKKDLQEASTRYPHRENDKKTSVGFLLPSQDAYQLADRMLEPHKGGWYRKLTRNSSFREQTVISETPPTNALVPVEEEPAKVEEADDEWANMFDGID